MSLPSYATPQDVLTDLAQRLRRLRIDANLTQAELAGKANLSQPTIQRLEQGRDGSTANLMAVLLALGQRAIFEHVAPADAYSPLQALRRTKERQRVRRSTKPSP